MKTKKLLSQMLAVAFALGFLLMPLNASAEEANKTVLYSAGSVCHCGGIRQESIVSKSYSPVYCTEHGATCANCYLEYTKTYYYCTNPYCTDLWYGETNEYTHIYGR